MSSDLQISSFINLTPDEIIKKFFKPQTQTQQAKIRSQIVAVANDSKEGNPSKIDSKHEALALSVLLRNYHRDKLSQDITDKEFYTYLNSTGSLNPPTAQTIKTLDIEYYGNTLIQEGEKPEWKFHINTSKKNIELSAATVLDKLPGIEDKDPAKRPVVMVLGAGPCNEIPLKELAHKYRVVLVDIDGHTLKKAVKDLPEDLRRYVKTEVRDLSGGVVTSFIEKVRNIVETSKSPTEMRRKTIELFEHTEIPTPLLTGVWKADFVVSSMLASQIPKFLIDETTKLLTTNNSSIPDDVTINLMAKMYNAHMEALTDVVRKNPQAGVYFATELVTTNKDPQGKSQVKEIAIVYYNGTNNKYSYLPDTSDISSPFKLLHPDVALTDFKPWIWAEGTQRYGPGSSSGYLVDAVLITAKPKASSTPLPMHRH